MRLHVPTPAEANTVSIQVPLGGTGRGFDTCCTNMPSDDVLLSLEEDEDAEEASRVAEE